MRRWAIATAATLALLTTQADAQPPTMAAPPATSESSRPSFGALLDRLSPWRRPQAPGPQKVARADAHLSPVEQIAGKMRQDEVNARSRIAALQYLARVPCHHSAEAETALLTALRADGNETVRFEAAKTLAQGCCCTPSVMKSLYCATSGAGLDGHPPEVSERVKGMALIALNRCQTIRRMWTAPDVGQRLAAQVPASREAGAVRQANWKVPEAPPAGADNHAAWRRWAETVGSPVAGPSGMRPLVSSPVIPSALPQPAPLQYIGQVAMPPLTVRLPPPDERP